MATISSESARRVPPQGKVSFEEYIEWLDEDTRAEWVDGEIVLLTSPTPIEHQDVAGFLYIVLHTYAEECDLGQVVFAPYVMKLAAITRGREPDLLFVQRDRLGLLTRNYLDGPADLAIEIVSPDSKRRDGKEKFAEYARAGVPEYWLIDPDHQTAEFYCLGEHGKYVRAALDAEGRYHSRVVTGFWLKVDWLWGTPLPTGLRVLRELQVL